MQQWKTMLENPAHFFPRRHAKYRDTDGLYPLHWACSGGPPVAIVQALLQSYPSAARKLDKEGSTPLHFACHYSASAAVVEALVSVYPEASARQDKYGRTPLYHAVDKAASLAVLQVLLKVERSAITLPCLPEKVRREDRTTRAMAVRTPLFLAWAAVLVDKSRRGKPWDKAKLLLEAATRDINNNDDDNSLLCRAIEMDRYLPHAVLPLLLATAVDNTNEDGQVPLALAAFTNFSSPERAHDVLQCLLQAFPTAVKSSSTLRIAAANGKTWEGGVQLLFCAAPHAIGWSNDSSTRLPPALAAATATTHPIDDDDDDEWLQDSDPYQLLDRKHRRPERKRVPVPRRSAETVQVETIFELLLADPTVVG
jgi:ankyrin repeat protein